MVVNVGIRDDQKEKINWIISAKRESYNSVNEFVQKGVDLLFEKEKSKIETGEDEVEKIFNQIDKFLGRILEDELEDRITITNRIAESIEEVLKTVGTFSTRFGYENKTSSLINAIKLKDLLNKVKENIILSNKEFPQRPIPQGYIKEIESLKKGFINAIKRIRK